MSQRSIRRIVKEPEITSVEPSASGQRQGAGRPSEVSAYANEIAAWLSEDRDPADGPNEEPGSAGSTPAERIHRRQDSGIRARQTPATARR